MKNQLKYLFGALAILVLGLAISFAAMASVAPSAEIIYVNLSCKINLDYLYAVKVDNIPDGAEVGVSVRIGSPDSNEIREAEYKGVAEIKGDTYRIYALPVNATEYSTNLYAKSYIKNGDDISYGQEKRNSVVEYVYTIGSSLGESVEELLSAILNYGGMAQRYFGVMTDRLANGDFYRITVENGAFADGYSSELFADGEEVTIYPTLKDGEDVNNWTDSSDAVVGLDTVVTVTVTKDETYTANVNSQGLPVTVADSNNGTAYRIVYDAESLYAENAAKDLAAAIKAHGFGDPEVASDAETATAYEIVIGEADREGTSEIRSHLDKASEISSEDCWWSYMYENGRLYILSDTSHGYFKAIKMLMSDYVKENRLVVYSELKKACGADNNEAILEAALDPNPHTAYMSYEIPSNFYEGYTDPFGMKDSDYKKMKLTFTNDTTYTIEYADDIGGTWKAAFVRKNWGCWMMGYIMYKDPLGKSSTIQTTGTDFEFVLSCGSKDIITRRGGNHGDYPNVYGGDWVWDAEDSAKSNDRLLDLTFYDGKSGEKIELEKGESVMLDGVRIVMHNNIYEMEYSQENVLFNVEKSYLYNGYDILCDSKLYMTQDVRFDHGGKSAMLPIQKDYSNNVLLYNMDGTVDYVKTLPAGQSVNTSLTGFKATKAELWGDANPELHTTVEILNPDHQFLYCNEEGYLQVRDMGERFNKIYFAPFNEATTLKHGTELNFKTKWSFSYEPDFAAPDCEPDIFIQ